MSSLLVLYGYFKLTGFADHPWCRLADDYAQDSTRAKRRWPKSHRLLGAFPSRGAHKCHIANEFQPR
jgi:hypothetical protein